MRAALAQRQAEPQEQEHEHESPPRVPRATLAALPRAAPSAAVATAVAAASLAMEMVAQGKSGANTERYHPGQWRVYRRLEYWTCCQTPSTGNAEASGCQSRLKAEVR